MKKLKLHNFSLNLLLFIIFYITKQYLLTHFKIHSFIHLKKKERRYLESRDNVQQMKVQQIFSLQDKIEFFHRDLDMKIQIINSSFVKKIRCEYLK